MSSSIEFKNFVLDQLRELDKITYKPMMGEFLLYYEGILFGGIYDDRFLIKKTNTNQKYNLAEELPYLGAKSMYMVENLDDVEYLRELIIETYEELKQKKG